MALYLVTGGCGFIGSHLVDALVAQGHGVKVLDDLLTGKREYIPHGVQITVGDIADYGVVADAMAGVDGCFHLAAIASVARCSENPVRANRVNLGGTVNILAAAKAAAVQNPIPVVYASSAAVYGSNTSVPLAETAGTRPLSQYGVDKLASEMHAEVAARIHGVPSIGLRFFNIYGPRQDPLSPYSGVISIFADRIGRGEPITFFGDGMQTRDFVYVGDVVRCLVICAHYLQAQRGAVAANVFNVCSGTATSILRLAEILMDLACQTVTVDYGHSREGDIRVSTGDPNAASRGLGFAVRTQLREGLSQLLLSRVSVGANLV
jgi:UDP-glucose 4-epimerase